MKRFYNEVEARAASGRDGDGWQVMLDGRGVKTMKGTPQVVPNESLALELATEWRGQGEEIDPAMFRLRDMVDYAIDIVAPHPEGVAYKLVAYGDTATLLYRADPDEPLHARQLEVWEPIVTGFEAREGVKLVRVSGIIHRQQDEAAMARLRDRLATLDPYSLAGVEAMTTLAASLVIGLSATEPDADGDGLWDAASLEEEWQADLWGRDEEAEDRRVRRRADFLTARWLTQLARS